MFRFASHFNADAVCGIQRHYRRRDPGIEKRAGPIRPG
jgi:hypothetical protein